MRSPPARHPTGPLFGHVYGTSGGRIAYSCTHRSSRTRRPLPHSPVVPLPHTARGTAPPHDVAPDAASLRERGGIFLRARRVNERHCLALVNKSSVFSLRALPARSCFDSPETRLIVRLTIGLVIYLSTVITSQFTLEVLSFLSKLLENPLFSQSKRNEHATSHSSRS
jgi:hypothetical protein